MAGQYRASVPRGLNGSHILRSAALGFVFILAVGACSSGTHRASSANSEAGSTTTFRGTPTLTVPGLVAPPRSYKPVFTGEAAGVEKAFRARLAAFELKDATAAIASQAKAGGIAGGITRVHEHLPDSSLPNQRHSGKGQHRDDRLRERDRRPQSDAERHDDPASTARRLDQGSRALEMGIRRQLDARDSPRPDIGDRHTSRPRPDRRARPAAEDRLRVPGEERRQPPPRASSSSAFPPTSRSLHSSP